MLVLRAPTGTPLAMVSVRTADLGAPSLVDLVDPYQSIWREIKFSPSQPVSLCSFSRSLVYRFHFHFLHGVHGAPLKREPFRSLLPPVLFSSLGKGPPLPLSLDFVHQLLFSVPYAPYETLLETLTRRSLTLFFPLFRSFSSLIDYLRICSFFKAE